MKKIIKNISVTNKIKIKMAHCLRVKKIKVKKIKQEQIQKSQQMKSR